MGNTTFRIAEIIEYKPFKFCVSKNVVTALYCLRRPTRQVLNTFSQERPTFAPLTLRWMLSDYREIQVSELSQPTTTP